VFDTDELDDVPCEAREDPDHIEWGDGVPDARPEPAPEGTRSGLPLPATWSAASRRLVDASLWFG